MIVAIIAIIPVYDILISLQSRNDQILSANSL